MHISGNKNYINTMNILKSDLTNFTENVTKKQPKNFDEVSISSKEVLDDTSFAKALSRKIISEVNAPSDKNKVEELKSQVQLGTYTVLPEEIVKKLLLS